METIVARLKAIDFIDIISEQNELALIVKNQQLILWTPTGIRTFAFVEDEMPVDLTQLEADVSSIKDNLGTLIGHVDGLEARLDALAYPNSVRETATISHTTLTASPHIFNFTKPSERHNQLTVYTYNQLNQSVTVDIFSYAVAGTPHSPIATKSGIGASGGTHIFLPGYSAERVAGYSVWDQLMNVHGQYAADGINPVISCRITPAADPTANEIVIVAIWKVNS